MAIPIIPRGDVPPEERAAFLKVACPPGSGGDNPDPLTPTVRIKRNLLVRFKLPLPDGTELPMWIIEDPDDHAGGRVFPSKLIRVVEGDIVHVRVGCQVGTHTIHWHGIEPSPMNDGVGKHSFEVDGNFIYQWLAGQAGTYFYHCHKNTPLHFIMGLYGALIIDPPNPPGLGGPTPPYPPGGPGFVAGLNPALQNVIKYDVEAVWAPSELDPRWHSLGHNAFMQKCDANDPAGRSTFTRGGFLNNFKPTVFVISGVPRVADNIPITNPGVAVQAAVGQTILLRILNAGYTITQFTIGRVGDPLPARVIAMDGRPLGVPPTGKYSFPFTVPGGRPIRLTSGQRWDLIFKPTVPGVFPAQVEYFDWVTGVKYATAQTTITVT